MIKLSQSAWNNVIIFSMLILIMLFNFSSHILNEGSSENLSFPKLVPANMVITTMIFEQEKVERIGQGWRTISGTYSNEKLARLVEHWNNAEIRLFDQGPSWQSANSTIQIWFAGQALPIEYQFIQLGDKTLVKIGKQTFQLISPSYQMLILPE
jgi:hypothetical protein